MQNDTLLCPYIINSPNTLYAYFKEAYSLLFLPAIKIQSGNQWLNLIIDTGSNDSILDKSVISNDMLLSSEFNTISGSGNNIKGYGRMKVPIVIGEIVYHDFNILDMKEAFTYCENRLGVPVHGILGSDFLLKTKSIIDYSNYMIISKIS